MQLGADVHLLDGLARALGQGGSDVRQVLLVVGFLLLRPGLVGGPVDPHPTGRGDHVDRDRDSWGCRRTIEGNVVRYRYVVDGTAWTTTHQFADTEWLPGDPLVACVDPGEPSRHALVQYDDVACGEHVAPGIDVAEPA